MTDLGTEFGVEVDEAGVTESHVFRGSVRVQVVGDGLPSHSGRGAGGEGSGREVILGENESARVQPDKDAEDRLIIVRGPVPGKAPSGFVRAMPRRVQERTFLAGVGDCGGPVAGVGAKWVAGAGF